MAISKRLLSIALSIVLAVGFMPSFNAWADDTVEGEQPAATGEGESGAADGDSTGGQESPSESEADGESGQSADSGQDVPATPSGEEQPAADQSDADAADVPEELGLEGQSDGEDSAEEEKDLDEQSDSKASVSYSAHVQNIGWQKWVKDGKTAGTSGRSLRVEALKAKIVDSNVEGGISYSAHVQNIGWQDWASNGAVAGTSGRSLRVEALKIKLTGDMESKFDVYYRVHVQDYGWLDWAKNGQEAGTVGMSKRVEAVQIELVEKGGKAPGATATPFKQRLVNYSTHVQNKGWLGSVGDGATAGTTGRSLRVEALKVSLGSGVSGGVSYSVHVQNIGWQKAVSNGAVAGTTGRSLRVEAVKISLTGDAASNYDIYYRVHSKDYGWLGWAKNGDAAGTEGLSKRVEALQIVLVPKGGSAPGSTSKPFVKKASSSSSSSSKGAKGSSGKVSSSTLKMTLNQMTKWQMDAGAVNGQSRSVVKNALDPSQHTTVATGYYEFANLSGYSGMTAKQIDDFISSTSSGRSGKLKGMGLAFVGAAKKYNVNECYLVSHAILESGWGTSTLASGFTYQGKTYYNFYGIGAYDSSPLSGGRAAAVKYGWTSPTNAIYGAAQWISTNYVNETTNSATGDYQQNTLYNMKWDYLRSNDTMARGWHQYATDPYWPTSIAKLMDECYSHSGVKPSLSYIVPAYKS